jgi:hypothetical protein
VGVSPPLGATGVGGGEGEGRDVDIGRAARLLCLEEEHPGLHPGQEHAWVDWDEYECRPQCRGRSLKVSNLLMHTLLVRRIAQYMLKPNGDGMPACVESCAANLHKHDSTQSHAVCSRACSELFALTKLPCHKTHYICSNRRHASVGSRARRNAFASFTMTPSCPLR